MKINNQNILKNGFYNVAILILGFASFLASGNDGIGDETIFSSTDSSTVSAGQFALFNAMGSLCHTLITSETVGAFDSLACNLNSENIGGLGNLVGNSNNSVQLQNLSPQAAMQAETISITSPKKFIRSINNRAQQLIECDSQLTKEGQLECNNGGGGSADAFSFIGPFGVSFSGGGGIGDRDNADGQTGFELDTRQANLIIDYSISQQLIAGFSFGYLGTDRDLALGSGSLDSDSFRFAPFILFRPTSNSYLTLTGGYALVNYDSTRKITPFNGITLNDATADYDADQYFSSLNVGYSFTFLDGWSLHGYGRADYIHTDIEGYQENGGEETNNNSISYALSVDAQNIDSLTSTLGAELSYSISTSVLYPAVIIPRFRAEWAHEFKNSGETIGTKLNGTSGISQTIESIAIAGPERNWANLGFGLQMLFPHEIVGYINYDALIIENASNHLITGGIRMSF